MYPALVVLWLGAQPMPAEQQPTVARWAAERGFRAVAVPPSPEPQYAEQVEREIESLLEETRSLSPGTAQLERLDQLLQQHPELPQAGWWLAERYALERQQAAGGQGSADAAAERRRAALEGTRAETAGAATDGAATAGAASDGAAGALPASLPLEPLGLRASDQLVLDGETVSAGAPVALGRHHAQVFRGQRRVWAGWVELDSAELRLPSVTAPCSELDLLGTLDASDAARPAPGVSCPSWAVAHIRAGRLELALCRADRCAPWQALDRSSSGPAAASAPGPDERWPAWLTWSALGLGAAASTALVLWQAGAFDRSAPTTEFVFTGPSAAAVRF